MIQTQYLVTRGRTRHTAKRRVSLSNADRIDNLCPYVGH